MLENKPNIQQYENLVSGISKLLSDAKNNIASTVNTTMVVTNWHIGQYIVEYEQGGKERAEYGTQLLKRLSEDLTKVFGRGFSLRNLKLIRKFYLTYQNWSFISAISEKGQTLSAQFSDKVIALLPKLTWSHFVRLLSVKYENERSFYIIESAENNWKERELDRQIFANEYKLYLPNKKELHKVLKQYI